MIFSDTVLELVPGDREIEWDIELISEVRMPSNSHVADFMAALQRDYSVALDQLAACKKPAKDLDKAIQCLIVCYPRG